MIHTRGGCLTHEEGSRVPPCSASSSPLLVITITVANVWVWENLRQLWPLRRALLWHALWLLLNYATPLVHRMRPHQAFATSTCFPSSNLRQQPAMCDNQQHKPPCGSIGCEGPGRASAPLRKRPTTAPSSPAVTVCGVSPLDKGQIIAQLQLAELLAQLPDRGSWHKQRQLPFVDDVGSSMQRQIVDVVGCRLLWLLWLLWLPPALALAAS